MPFRGQFVAPSGGGGGGGGTALSTAIPLSATLQPHVQAVETDVTTVDRSEAGGAGVADAVNAVMSGPIVPDVAFDSGYTAAGLRFDGYDVLGVEQTETITAVANSTVHGTKVFSSFTSITTSSPGGAFGPKARIQISRKLCPPSPFAAIVAVYDATTGGGVQGVGSVSASAGWLILASGAPPQGTAYEVLYTKAHTHTIT